MQLDIPNLTDEEREQLVGLVKKVSGGRPAALLMLPSTDDIFALLEIWSTDVFAPKADMFQRVVDSLPKTMSKEDVAFVISGVLVNYCPTFEDAETTLGMCLPLSNMGIRRRDELLSAAPTANARPV